MNKNLWNSAISTADGKYMCNNIANMYLMTLMDLFKYMGIRSDIVHDAFIEEYKLRENNQERVPIHGNLPWNLCISKTRHRGT